MTVSEEQLNELIENLSAGYRMKGSISTNQLCNELEKYDLTPQQYDQIYKSLPDLGISIYDEDERDKELLDQALSDIGLDDPVKM